MKKTIIFALVLNACAMEYEIVYPETIIHYEQIGKNCQYSEKHGKWFYENRFADPFFVTSNKRTVTYDDTSCTKILDADIKNFKERDVFYKSSLAAPTLEQEVGMRYQIK
jgi:hypothetical protein